MSGEREAILTDITATLAAVSGIESAGRKPADEDFLSGIPESKFPYAVVLGGIPVPIEPVHVEASDQSAVEMVLNIEIRIFGNENVNPDTQISTVFDAAWTGLYADPTVDGNARSLSVIPVATPLYNMPYWRFDLMCEVHYIYYTG